MTGSREKGKYSRLYQQSVMEYSGLCYISNLTVETGCHATVQAGCHGAHSCKLFWFEFVILFCHQVNSPTAIATLARVWDEEVQTLVSRASTNSAVCPASGTFLLLLCLALCLQLSLPLFLLQFLPFCLGHSTCKVWNQAREIPSTHINLPHTTHTHLKSCFIFYPASSVNHCTVYTHSLSSTWGPFSCCLATGLS